MHCGNVEPQTLKSLTVRKLVFADEARVDAKRGPHVGDVADSSCTLKLQLPRPTRMSSPSRSDHHSSLGKTTRWRVAQAKPSARKAQSSTPTIHPHSGFLGEALVSRTGRCASAQTSVDGAWLQGSS